MSAVLLFVGSAVTLGIMFPNTAHREKTTLRNEPIQVYRDPVPERLTQSDRSRALQTALRFVNTAVARRHTVDSYALVTPALRAGMTKQQWAEGEIPVTPYPATEARVRVDYSYRNEVGLKVLLFPPSRSALNAMTFNMELRALGSGSNRRWLVNDFTPSSVASPMNSEPGERSASGSMNLAPNTDGLDSPIAAGWIWLPVGLLGTVLLIPLGIGIRSWRENRRAFREYERSRATGPGLAENASHFRRLKSLLPESRRR